MQAYEESRQPPRFSLDGNRLDSEARRVRANAKLVFDDTVRFAMYACGMLAVERWRTGKSSWAEKGWMLVAGMLGSALFHNWMKPHLHSSVLFPDK
jgi:hypothetical protein